MNGKYSHSRFCNFCNSANAPARLSVIDYGNEIVTEAKYVCPKCGNLVAKEIVSREPKQKK